MSGRDGGGDPVSNKQKSCWDKGKFRTEDKCLCCLYGMNGGKRRHYCNNACEKNVQETETDFMVEHRLLFHMQSVYRFIPNKRHETY